MTQRLVIVGRNSAIWRRLQHKLTGQATLALSHAELVNARLEPNDQVWILSYSRVAAENRALFEALKATRASAYHYISTATANVAAVTRCYSYPIAKADAESAAQRILGAQIVRIGVVYDDERELPAGRNAATSLDEIAAAMSSTFASGGARRDLFRLVARPFRSAFERRAYRVYGHLLAKAGGFPCLLRPLDVILGRLGMRWYGYLYLSNQLWIAGGLPTAEGREGSEER